MKKIYILTGPSGAGASTAKFVFEELGFYILENFPAVLTNELIDKVIANRPDSEKVCLIPRIAEAKALFMELKKRNDFEVVTILLDCSSEELIHRYTLTRHIHPSSALSGISLEKAIENDLVLVNQLRGGCDLYIDTYNDVRGWLMFNEDLGDLGGFTLYESTPTFDLYMPSIYRLTLVK